MVVEKRAAGEASDGPFLVYVVAVVAESERRSKSKVSRSATTDRRKVERKNSLL
jgi:hypothetical protein